MLTYKQLKELKNIDLPTGRVYDLPHAKYPSITTILGATADKTWLDRWIQSVGVEEAERIKNDAAIRGTKVHDYLERFYEEYPQATKQDAKSFIKESGLATEPMFIRRMVVELLKHLLANQFHSLAQEIVVWDDELEIAGRCDSIGYLKNNLYVIDYKTARKEKQIKFIRDYFLQASFYTVSYNKMFGENINQFAILIANEQGGSQVFTGNPQVYLPELKRRVKMFYEQKKTQRD